MTEFPPTLVMSNMESERKYLPPRIKETFIPIKNITRALPKGFKDGTPCPYPSMNLTISSNLYNNLEFEEKPALSWYSTVGNRNPTTLDMAGTCPLKVLGWHCNFTTKTYNLTNIFEGGVGYHLQGRGTRRPKTGKNIVPKGRGMNQEEKIKMAEKLNNKPIFKFSPTTKRRRASTIKISSKTLVRVKAAITSGSTLNGSSTSLQPFQLRQTKNSKHLHKKKLSPIKPLASATFSPSLAITTKTNIGGELPPTLVMSNMDRLDKKKLSLIRPPASAKLSPSLNITTNTNTRQRRTGWVLPPGGLRGGMPPKRSLPPKQVYKHSEASFKKKPNL